MENNNLRIGILADDKFNYQFIRELLIWAEKQNNINISHLFIHTPKKKSVKINLSLFKKITFFFISHIEKFCLLFFKKYQYYLNKTDVSDYFSKIVFLNGTYSKNNIFLDFGTDDLKKIKEEHIDLLIRSGSGILKGGILNCCKFGVISFHHGDNTKYRGSPPGFWEVYYKEDQTGFVLQQLNNTLDGGKVIERGEFKTQFFYLLNQAFIFKKSLFYLKRALVNIQNQNEITFKDFKLISKKIFKIPNIYCQFIYILKLFYRLIDKLINQKILRKNLIWKVAYNFNNSKDLSKSKKIKNHINCFLADPFIYKMNNKNYLFAEEYDFKKKKGHIVCFREENKEFTNKQVVLNESFHLSFPYLFNFENKTYMCPDTSSNNDIRLYECKSFPNEWELKKVLINNIKSADTMIFKLDSKWWLFTNEDKSGLEDYNSELSIYYSEDGPISENWIPHRQNPVITNSLNGRNAGLIKKGEKFFRVSQAHSNDQYGKYININEIVILNEKNYIEKKLEEVKISEIGNHHMSSYENIVAFDYL